MPILLELPDLTAGVTWSVAVRDAADSRLLASRTPERVLRTASIGKVFLLLYAADLLTRGELDPNEPLAWSADELVADSGIWHTLRANPLPLADLCTLVGAVSDNLATNVLVRRLGIDPVRALARSLGCRDSALLDRVRDERGPDVPPTLSVGRADELSDLMARLHRGEAVSVDASALVRSWLAGNTDLSMVAAALGLDPLAHAEPDRGVRLFNKTGTISVVRADIGVVEGPAGALAYAACAEWSTGSDRRDAVLASMRTLGDRLRAAVAGPAG